MTTEYVPMGLWKRDGSEEDLERKRRASCNSQVTMKKAETEGEVLRERGHIPRVFPNSQADKRKGEILETEV